MNHAVHGRWVKFGLRIEGAHLTPDGKTLGIYQRAREGVAVNGAVTPAAPEHVAVVRPDGTNLVRLGGDGQTLEAVRLAPGDCPGLCAAAVPGDLPDCPRNAHLFVKTEADAKTKP